MNRHPTLLVRALDHHLGDACLLARGKNVLAHLEVLVQEACIFAARRVPPRNPGAVDAEPKPDRIDLLPHQADSSTWRTMTVICANGFSILAARPLARAFKRFITSFLPT